MIGGTDGVATELHLFNISSQYMPFGGEKKMKSDSKIKFKAIETRI